MTADMHVHTYYSDGKLTPEQVAQQAVRNGVDFVVVTDHDNANGSNDVISACEKRGVKSVTGIEISAYVGDVKVHTLGYGFDANHPAFLAFYKKICENAFLRTQDILQKLQAVGVSIGMEEVMACRACERSPLHATYIAEAAAKKGYAASLGAFYMRYLNYGTAGFSAILRPTPEEALDVIHRCGGVSSLAHPGRISMDEQEKLKLIFRMKDCGLQGIEAVYSGHTMGETAYYKEIATKHRLLITGGSDTHYATGNRQIGVPAFVPDQALLCALHLL